MGHCASSFHFVSRNSLHGGSPKPLLTKTKDPKNYGASHFRFFYSYFLQKSCSYVVTLTLGLQLNVEWKGPWGQEGVFGCETHFHKWGRVQKMQPNDSQVHSRFGSYTRARVLNVQSLCWKGKKNKIWPLGYHWKSLEM
jgi:hypothetical protein